MLLVCLCLYLLCCLKPGDEDKPGGWRGGECGEGQE